MAYALIWSPEAIEDIEAIATFIERDSPWYARAVVTKIVEVAESIPEYPELGRMVQELDDPAIRERIAHCYRIVYRLAGRGPDGRMEGPPILATRHPIQVDLPCRPFGAAIPSCFRYRA